MASSAVAKLLQCNATRTLSLMKSALSSRVAQSFPNVSTATQGLRQYSSIIANSEPKTRSLLPFSSSSILGELASSSSSSSSSSALSAQSQQVRFIRKRTWAAVCGSLNFDKKLPWKFDQSPPPLPDTKPLSRDRVMRQFMFKDIIMPNDTQLRFGLYGIRTLEAASLKENTLEAVRRTIRRKIKKTGRLWIMIRATVPVTKKPLGIRMGKGKGSIDHYVTPIRPGQILYEFDRVSKPVAVQALRAIQPKLPCRLGLVEFN